MTVAREMDDNIPVLDAEELALLNDQLFAVNGVLYREKSHFTSPTALTPHEYDVFSRLLALDIVEFCGDNIVITSLGNIARSLPKIRERKSQ